MAGCGERNQPYPTFSPCRAPWPEPLGPAGPAPPSPPARSPGTGPPPRAAHLPCRAGPAPRQPLCFRSSRRPPGSGVARPPPGGGDAEVGRPRTQCGAVPATVPASVSAARRGTGAGPWFGPSGPSSSPDPAYAWDRRPGRRQADASARLGPWIGWLPRQGPWQRWVEGRQVRPARSQRRPGCCPGWAAECCCQLGPHTDCWVPPL